jgi:hypothetical protein
MYKRQLTLIRDERELSQHHIFKQQRSHNGRIYAKLVIKAEKRKWRKGLKCGGRVKRDKNGDKNR